MAQKPGKVSQADHDKSLSRPNFCSGNLEVLVRPYVSAALASRETFFEGRDLVFVFL